MSMSPGSRVRSPTSSTTASAGTELRRDLDDAFAVDEQLAGRHELAGVDVEQPGAAQQGGRLRGFGDGPWGSLA